MSIKKSLAWMGIAQAAAFVIQFASSVVLAHYLSPRDMGIFGIGLATVAVLALIQNFGLQPLIVREEVLTPAIRATAFTVNAIIILLQSAATVLLAFAGASFLGDAGVKNVLLVLSISPLFGIFSFLPGAELERHARFKATALITFLTNLLGGAAMIAFAVMGLGYMSLAYANVISSAVLAIAFIAIGREFFSCRLGLAQWKHISSFGFQMFAYSGIVNLSQRICEILLGRISGLESLGLYNRASGINNMLWGNVHYLASRIVLVDFAMLHRARTPLKARYIQSVAMITGTLWPAFAGLAVLAAPFITIVYGARWSAAVIPLAYLSIASIIRVSMTTSWELFTVTGNTSAQTRIELVRTLISVPLFVGACFISLNAVAFTRIIDALIAFVLYRPHLDAMTNTSLKDMRWVYVQGILVTIAAIVPALVLTAELPQLSMQVPYVIAAISLGILLWACALFVIKHPLAEEVSRGLQSLNSIRDRSQSSSADKLI